MNAHSRRKARQNVSAFGTLIASPAVGDFAMPAGGRIRFVATAGSVEGDTAATLTGAYRSLSEDEDGNVVRSEEPEPRVIKTPELETGGHVVIDYIERAVNVDPEAGFDVEVDTGLGVWKKIAEGA